jgi:GT2 family glycosyltransferase
MKHLIIIPVFGNAKMLHMMLESLLPTIDLDCEVFVVDDGHPEMKIDAGRLPGRVIYLSNERNLGYSAAVNRALAEAQGDLVTTINSDIILTGDWLAQTRRVFEELPDAGAVGAKLIYPTDGLVMHAGVFFSPHAAINAFRMSRQDDPLVNARLRVQAVSDALFSVRRDCLRRAGNYDEAYLTSYEDMELCMRVRELGYEVYYEPRIVAFHYTAASGEARYQGVDAGQELFFERWRHRLNDDSGAIFAKSLARFAAQGRQLPAAAYVVNINRKNSVDTLAQFRRWSQVEIAEVLDFSSYVASTPRFVQRNGVDLLDALPFSCLHLKLPIVHLIDFYTSLRDNYFWLEQRRDMGDVVFDYAYNLVPFSACGAGTGPTGGYGN